MFNLCCFVLTVITVERTQSTFVANLDKARAWGLADPNKGVYIIGQIETRPSSSLLAVVSILQSYSCIDVFIKSDGVIKKRNDARNAAMDGFDVNDEQMNEQRFDHPSGFKIIFKNTYKCVANLTGEYNYGGH